MTTIVSRLSRRARIAIIVAAGLVSVYALAGFFIVPGIVKRQIESQVGANLRRRSTVGSVRVNPFALSVTVDSLRVADRDGVLLFGWDELYVNAELISVVRRELDLLEVRLVGPYGRLVIRRDGTLNVSDIVDSMNAASKAAPSSGPPPVLSVDELHIDGARFDVVDSATRRPFKSTIGPWKIDLNAFATRRDANSKYSFSGRTESGESFAWAGEFAIDPLRSSGKFSLDSLRLSKYGPFYERTVGFDVPRGIAGISAGYELDFGPANRKMRLVGGELTVSGLSLVERARGDTALDVQSARLSGLEVDAAAHRATIGSITVGGGTVRVSRARDSTINFLRMLVVPVDSAPPVAPAPAKAVAPATPAPVWRWLIGRMAAESVTVRVLDSVPTRPATLLLSSVTASIDTLASDSATVSRLHATAAWAPRGALTADGTVRIWHRDGQIAFTAKDVSLRPFDTYLAPAMNMLITDGRLASEATVRFAVADTLHPDFGFKGNVRVDRFATVDGLRREPFFSFRAFRLTGIDYGYRAHTIALKEIVLDDPVIELGVAADGTPVTRIIFAKPGADSAAKDSAAKDSTVKDPVPAAPAPAPAKSAAPGAPAMRVSIGRVRVTNGAIRMSDKSVEPAVAFAITKIDAVTGKLSSDSLGTGTLALTAAIDDVAPVKVSGSFNPLSSKEGSDLAVDIQGWELIPVGPYSGRYLGYLISQGKMKVEMKYRVVGRELKAENKLTIDQFTFGDATNSPDATKMPVKLGIAVMRDRDGQIVFDVPVEGNLDDPNFRMGRVIGRAIMNVLTKLITSPFKLLGGLFGGGSADLSFVEFSPGSASLAPAETKKLDVLARSLYERPALKLSIAGAVDTLADAAALRSAKLDARLRQAKWTALKAKDANTPPPDSLILTPTDRPAWLTAVYSAAFPADSAVLAAKKSKSALPPVPPAEMERRVLATIPVPPDDLRLLAAARAKRCLDYILSAPGPKLEPERVFLTEGAVKPDGAKAIFTLQ